MTQKLTGAGTHIPKTRKWLLAHGLPYRKPYIIVFDHGKKLKFATTVAVGVAYNRSTTTVRKAIRTGCELVEGVTVDWEDLA